VTVRQDSRDTDFLQHLQAIQLADRLDNPGQHQLGAHLVAVRGIGEPEHPIGVLQGIQQAAHPRGGNRQRPAPSRPLRHA
jgi:hypothetical protein